MRELVYYIATTLDGFIARPDGSFEDFPWDDDFINALMETYPETLPAPMRPGATRGENKGFDTVLMGRRTYQVGSSQGLTSPYPTLDQYVFSRSMTESPDPAVTLVNTDMVGAVSQLKAAEGRAIWICGGSEVATHLLTAGLIDRVVLKVAPVLFGTGVPLFRDEVPARPLHVESRRDFVSGYTLTEYRVDNGNSQP